MGQPRCLRPFGLHGGNETAAAITGKFHCRKGVCSLARLSYGDNQRLIVEHRVSIAKLGCVLCVCRDASKGFEDPLGAAGASGRVSLRRDDSAVLAAMRRLNLQITKRLGYPRLVRGE